MGKSDYLCSYISPSSCILDKLTSRLEKTLLALSNLRHIQLLIKDWV